MDDASDVWNDELFAAIKLGRVDIVKALIERGANINARDTDRKTPLELAVSNQLPEVVDTLLSAGVDPFVNPHLRNSALWHAIENLNASSEVHREMQLSIMKRLLETGIITRDPVGRTWREALDNAVRNGHSDAVSLFLEFGADPNIAAFTAIENGRYDIFLLLLDAGCDVRWDMVDVPRDTLEAESIAFQAAARSGSRDLVRHFLDAGAHPNIEVKGIPIVLCAAAESGNGKVVRMLIDAGADVAGTSSPDFHWRAYNLLSCPIREGNVPILQLLLEAGASEGEALNIAVSYGAKELVEWLIDRGTGINTTSRWGETALMKAVSAAPSRISFELVDWLLAHGADINHADERGYTALKRAAATPELVSKLITAGADPNGGWGMTPLMLAAVESQECVLMLLEAGANVNAVTQDGDMAWRIADESKHEEIKALLIEWGAQEPTIYKTHLHAAILWNKTDDILRLIQEGADIEALDSDGRTPLLAAIHSQCELRVIKALLAAGANPNRIGQDLGDELPLSNAVWHSTLEVVRTLIDHGADLNTSKRLQSALSCAVTADVDFDPPAYPGRPAIIRLLLESGASPDVYDDAGLAPLHKAADHGHMPLMELLLDHGANIDIRCQSDNACGYTPLLHACWRSQYEAARYLIERGADVNAHGDYGGTPLINVCRHPFATEYSCVEVVKPSVQEDNTEDREDAAIRLAELLICRGANVNYGDPDGDTPLLLACRIYTSSTRRLALIRLLLEAGADVNVEDMNAETPLTYARQRRSQEMEELLREYGAA